MLSSDPPRPTPAPAPAVQEPSMSNSPLNSGHWFRVHHKPETSLKWAMLSDTDHSTPSTAWIPPSRNRPGPAAALALSAWIAHLAEPLTERARPGPNPIL